MREKEIVRELLQKNPMKPDELTSDLNVSKKTIRNEITFLNRQYKEICQS